MSTVDDLHRNLIVNYLPQGWTAHDLTSVFSQCGEIEDCKVVKDRQSNMSKGFGFVKFYSRADAEQALRELQGYTAEGKILRIEKADFGKGPRGPASVYVAGFDRSSQVEEELRRFFGEFGTIVGVKSIPPRDDAPRQGENQREETQRQGVMFIDYSSFAEAELAVRNMHGKPLGEGRTLTVRLGKKSASTAAHFAAQRAVGAAAVASAGPPSLVPFVSGVPSAYMNFAPPLPCQALPYSASPLPSMRSYPLSTTADYSPTCVFVYGVSDEARLRQIAEEFIPVHRVQVPPGKRYGFVHTLTPMDASTLVDKLDGRRVRGLPAPLQARWKTQPH